MNNVYSMHYGPYKSAATTLVLAFDDIREGYDVEFFNKWEDYIWVWQEGNNNLLQPPKLAAIIDRSSLKNMVILDWLGVHPLHRRRGYALDFLYFIRQTFGRTGLRVLRSNTPALKLYSKAGFEIIERDIDSFYMESTF